jgi:hypothetical protein
VSALDRMADSCGPRQHPAFDSGIRSLARAGPLFAAKLSDGGAVAQRRSQRKATGATDRLVDLIDQVRASGGGGEPAHVTASRVWESLPKPPRDDDTVMALMMVGIDAVRDAGGTPREATLPDEVIRAILEHDSPQSLSEKKLPHAVRVTLAGIGFMSLAAEAGRDRLSNPTHRSHRQRERSERSP